MVWDHNLSLNRRAWLAAAAGALLARRLDAGEPGVNDGLLGYLNSLARPDGAYGWADQPDSQLTPTWAVVGCLHLLGQRPAEPAALADWVLRHHPITGADSETKNHSAELKHLVLQQLETVLRLGAEPGPLRDQIAGWQKLSTYPVNYEIGGHPIFREEMVVLQARHALNLPAAETAPALVTYLDSRRRPDGSFNNTPAADGSGGHVVNTLWGLLALAYLGREGEHRDATVAWLQACQLPSGGFTWCPRPSFAGRDDVWYTWAAVRGLALLGAAPADRAGCVAWLKSLCWSDGGCGDRPGLPSSPVATLHTLEALQALGELEQAASFAPRFAVRPAAIPAGLRPFTIQLEAPGDGSPAEAIRLAKELRIALWGAKNSPAGWVEAVQTAADAAGVATRFFVSNEEYGTYTGVPGFGFYSHLSDPCAPAGSDFGPSVAGRQPAPTWEQFRTDRLAPLTAAGGGNIWQICDNEEFSRLLLDDSVERGGGFVALSTFHFGQNFAFTLPWWYRYRHELPFVSLQDAHGNESWWWIDDLVGYRTLFLAEEPTWEAWLEALRRNWVCGVRHDAVTRFKTRFMGGGPGVVERCLAHEDAWRWWGDDPADLPRPHVSLVALRPGAAFEDGVPERGVNLRVRLDYRTGGGQPREARAELLGLTLDGRPVAMHAVERRNERQLLTEAYLLAELGELPAGQHTAVATAKLLASGRVVTETTTFES